MRLTLLIALCGCAKAPPPPVEEPVPGFDCQSLRARPGSALSEIGGLTRDPIEVWRTIEVCGAEGPDPCAKALAGHRAVPSMAVVDGLDTRPLDAPWLKACRQLTPAQQRCMRLSARMRDPEACVATGAKAAHAALFRPQP